MPVDPDTQAAIDALGTRIEELAALHADDASAEKIEAKEEQVEAAAERAGLSDEDADKLADRISAKLATAINPDALAEKVTENMKAWAEEPEEGAEELETVAGRKPDEPKAEESAGEKPTEGEKPGEESPNGAGDGTPDPPAHWFDRPLSRIFD